ncbi:hypothetical protein EDD21DRAFT_368268 [Dissophora ornata]|nr:hypothetical protein BGZ58_008838 [Dissophora ornata]KAI8603725.1 hypothetical protein EDD21DRAFT_368268 [Dissophora ornata]
MLNARYLEGTAYILYGPAPTPLPESSASQDHNANFGHPTSTNASSHATCQHQHHLHRETPDKDVAHFWAVFRPEIDTQIKKKQSGYQEILTPQQETESLMAASDNPILKQNGIQSFVLTGTPHPWGSYPANISEPHGCIPPHLYYRVTVSEYHRELSETSTGHREWVLPFVHRLGDGRDDAGGLTSAYSLLEDLEDADDFGDFISRTLQKLRSGEGGGEVGPNLYACTEVLISEQRTMNVIEQQFFEMSINNSERLPKELEKLQHNIEESLARTTSTSQQLPFHLVKSELKLILPIQS